MALTLTRKLGEVLRFTATADIPAGTVIEIEVRDIRRNQVRLQSRAPADIAIDRPEVLARTAAEDIQMAVVLVPVKGE